jgi:hypothetical protein
VTKTLVICGETAFSQRHREDSNHYVTNQAGGLTRDVNVDITSYILSVNEFPAGEAELPRDTQIPKQIRIETPKERRTSREPGGCDRGSQTQGLFGDFDPWSGRITSQPATFSQAFATKAIVATRVGTSLNDLSRNSEL